MYSFGDAMENEAASRTGLFRLFSLQALFSTSPYLLFLTFVVPLFLDSCVKLGPDFSPPKAPLAEAWLEIDGTRFKPEQADFREWWKAFNDPVLERLIQTAYQQNLPLRVAGLRIFEARASLGIAIGNWYPQLQTGDAAISYSRQSEYAPGGQSASKAGSNEFAFGEGQLGGTASWEMDFWGKFSRSIESADAVMLTSIAAYDQALVTLLGDVASTYLQTRVLEERLRIAQSNVKAQEESLQIAQARFEGGATGARDVQQALSQLYGTKATIPYLEYLLQQSKNALSILLGFPPAQLGDLLSGKGGIPDAPVAVAVGIPGDLVRRRPDIRAAEYQAAAQSAQIGVSEADLYPAFSLTGNFGFLATDQEGAKIGDMFSWRGHTGTVGPTFQWNLFNYGRITNNVRVQDARFQELVVQYQEAVLQAQADVENSLVAFAKAGERTELLKNAVNAAQKTLELAMVEYRDGATDYTTVLTAEQNLLAEQDNLVQSQGSIPLALVSVYRSLGGGWQIREGKNFIPDETKQVMTQRSDWGDLLSIVSVENAVSRNDDALQCPDW